MKPVRSPTASASLPIKVQTRARSKAKLALPALDADAVGTTSEEDERSPGSTSTVVEMRALFADMAVMHERQFNGLQTSMASIMSEMRELRRETAENRALITGAVTRIDDIEQRLEVVERREAAPPAPPADFAELEHTVAQLRRELADRDQEALLSDLEIGNLPEERGENVAHAVAVLAARLGVRLEERDIVFAERVGAVSLAPPERDAEGARGAVGESRVRRIVVRLARRSLRDELMRAARTRRTLAPDDAGSSKAGAPGGRIFVNERLTRANRQLFYRVREECRKWQWRYSWTRRGRIFARQADGKPAHQIQSSLDVERVFSVSD